MFLPPRLEIFPFPGIVCGRPLLSFFSLFLFPTLKNKLFISICIPLKHTNSLFLPICSLLLFLFLLLTQTHAHSIYLYLFYFYFLLLILLISLVSSSFFDSSYNINDSPPPQTNLLLTYIFIFSLFPSLSFLILSCVHPHPLFVFSIVQGLFLSFNPSLKMTSLLSP